jgi:hypothetical protein
VIFRTCCLDETLIHIGAVIGFIAKLVPRFASVFIDTLSFSEFLAFTTIDAFTFVISVLINALLIVITVGNHSLTFVNVFTRAINFDVSLFTFFYLRILFAIRIDIFGDLFSSNTWFGNTSELSRSIDTLLILEGAWIWSTSTLINVCTSSINEGVSISTGFTTESSISIGSLNTSVILRTTCFRADGWNNDGCLSFNQFLGAINVGNVCGEKKNGKNVSNTRQPVRKETNNR